QGSELAKLTATLAAGLPPFDLAVVAQAIELVRKAVRDGKLGSAHDVSEGGLACAVAECAISGGVGVSLDLEPLLQRGKVDATTALFGEGPGGIVISGSREQLMEVSKEAASVGFLALGSVGGEAIRLAARAAT